MKIRIIGLPEEVDQAKTRLEEAFDVIDASNPYPCRGNSRQVRLYLEIRL